MFQLRCFLFFFFLLASTMVCIGIGTACNMRLLLIVDNQRSTQIVLGFRDAFDAFEDFCIIGYFIRKRFEIPSGGGSSAI